jgi:hypothetical protein
MVGIEISGSGENGMRQAGGADKLTHLFSGDFQRIPGLGRLVPETTLLVVFVLFFAWLKRSSALPLEYNETPFVFGAYLKFVLLNWKFMILALVFGCLTFLRRRNLALRWLDVDQGPVLRLIVIAAAIAVSWPLICSNYDFLYGQHYWLDRLCLLIALAGICFRPGFVLPFMLVSAPMIWMRDAKVGVFPWEFYGLPLRIVALLFIWLLFEPHKEKQRGKTLLYVMIVVLAGHYWIPGLAKLRIGWLLENDIYYLHTSAYGNGWLSFLAPESVSRIARSLMPFNSVMKIGTVILECGCLLILLGRRSTILFFLLGFSLFHIGVVFVAGIFMWQWLCVDLMVAMIFLRSRDPGALLPPGRLHAIVAILLIGTAPVWLRSARLVWFDTPVNYMYRFEAIGEDGERGDLPPRFFSPHDLEFAFSGFSYLVEEQPLMSIAWGATGRHTAAGFKNAETVEEVFAFERAHGRSHHDPVRAERMRTFLVHFINNYNRAPENYRSVPWIAPPPALVTIPRENNFDVGRPIRRIEVTHVTTYFDGSVYREIRKFPVMTIEIPTP